MKVRHTLACILTIAASMGAAACGRTQVHSLTEQTFAPKSRPEDVRLFLGKLDRPSVAIAKIDSTLDQSDSVGAKRAMLADLRTRAAKLGADAVVDIRLLKEKRHGFMADPTVPFKAWQQGDYDLYFLRGTAVRFDVKDDEAVLEWEEQQAGMTLEDKAAAPEGVDVDRIPVEEEPQEAATGTGGHVHNEGI